MHGSIAEMNRRKNLFLKFCDWAVDITADLSDEQMEQMLGNEHGGMNEVLADAYAITYDAKYLSCARRFSHKQLLAPMEKGKDCLDNMHANTQIPKVIGYQRIAELAHDMQYHNASEYFWEIVTRQRSLALGGNSRREHFPTKETCIDYVNDIDGPETCNTYNMLKLTEDLNRVNHQGMYGDFYETAMFNHILSAQHPEHGGYVYFTSARPRHYRNYSAPNKAMWCCVGTGMEDHGKYGQFIWTHDKGMKTEDDALYVNLFVASELNWKERKMMLRQQTAFPYAETSNIEVTKGKGVFTLKIRKPLWCDNFTVMGIGFAVDCYEENGFVCIKRKWKKGNQVEISMPMHAYIKPMINVPQYVAIMYGPILLGMKSGTEDMRSLIADDSRFGQYADGMKLPLDKALEARTVDKVSPGEQQPETDHRMETDDSSKGNTEGIFFRDAEDGHYFSYLMQTKGETNLSLQLKFWGQDEWRTSEFDIYVNDKLLCSVNNSHRWRTTQFKTVDYAISSEFVKGKKEIRVKFVAQKGKQVGQIYGVRLVKN